MSIFHDVKAQVTVAEACRHYGVELNRHHKACCPFHEEKTPSFSLYDQGRRWHCFGCGEGGDVVDFVARLMGLGNLEAAKQIATDFGVAVAELRPEEWKANKARYEARKAAEAEKKAFRARVEAALTDYRRLLFQQGKNCEALDALLDEIMKKGSYE